MNREEMARRADRDGACDLLVIGGGATGLGVAVDAAARGYRAVLLERGDFAQGTSSRSTKLVHGGVRYLQQGDIALVLEALQERGILRRNAPHLVRDLRFVVPTYDWWESPFYGVGLKVYDMLAGKLGFGSSRVLSRSETLERIPTIEQEGLRGGVLYFDGQFDDARLAVNLAQTAAEQGAVVLNYAEVTGLLERRGLVAGARFRDRESGRESEIEARVVVNATGVFSDSIRRMDDPGAAPIIRASQGVHIVLRREFLPGDSAIMVPHTDDGRVLFAIPWHHRVLVGTTDTPVDSIAVEPRPLPEELEFLLRHCARYLSRDPGPEDVLSMFAGLRPLVGSLAQERTSAISRDHTVCVARSGLVTVAGGKWTTYRRMAEDTVDRAALIAGLPERPCSTARLPIHGHCPAAAPAGAFADYGADADAIAEIVARDPELAAPLQPGFPDPAGLVAWAVRREMARTVEDVLARRVRLLVLDAAASRRAAPGVARLMARELGRGDAWVAEQVRAYDALARGYLPG